MIAARTDLIGKVFVAEVAAEGSNWHTRDFDVDGHWPELVSICGADAKKNPGVIGYNAIETAPRLWSVFRLYNLPRP